MINVAGKICTFVKKIFAALFQSTLKKNIKTFLPEISLFL
jgi:hypothetical protein